MSARTVIKHVPNQGRGVSLAKRGVLSPSATRTVRAPEFIVATRRGVDVDASLSEWTVAGLDRNDLRLLSRAFAVLGLFGRGRG